MAGKRRAEFLFFEMSEDEEHVVRQPELNFEHWEVCNPLKCIPLSPLWKCVFSDETMRDRGGGRQRNRGGENAQTERMSSHSCLHTHFLIELDPGDCNPGLYQINFSEPKQSTPVDPQDPLKSGRDEGV